MIQAQETAREAAEAQALALADLSVRSFRGWYDTGAITRWATDLAGQVESIQRALARSADAYLGQISSLATDKRVRPVGAIDVSTLRTGVTHAGVYGRVADTYRYQASKLKDDPSLVDPLDAALKRAEVTATLDTQLAVTRQSQAFMAAQRTITGYRRVIHSELSKGGTCGLCIAASDRLYKPQELMPIHARCACLPLPVYDGKDLGSALNDGDLRRLYDDAGSTNRADLTKTRYKVDEHSELGPLLTKHGAPVRSAADAAKDETH